MFQRANKLKEKYERSNELGNIELALTTMTIECYQAQWTNLYC